jgi:hypothetical protein
VLTPAMGAAPCSAGAAGWRPRAPVPHPHHPLAPSNPSSHPTSSRPNHPCTAPPPWGFPPNPPPPPKIKRGEEGVGRRKEAREAGKKLGAAVVRGLRRRAGTADSPCVKKKTEEEKGEREPALLRRRPA